MALIKRGIMKEVRVCSSSCLDLCENGVAAVQEPEHVAYGKIQPEDVDEIAEALEKRTVVDRLVVHR